MMIITEKSMIVLNFRRLATRARRSAKLAVKRGLKLGFALGIIFPAFLMAAHIVPQLIGHESLLVLIFGRI